MFAQRVRMVLNAKLFLLFLIMSFGLLTAHAQEVSETDSIRQQIDTDLKQEIIGYKEKDVVLSGLPKDKIGNLPAFARIPIYRYEYTQPRPHPTTPNVYVVSVIDKLEAQRNIKTAVAREYLYFADKNEKGEVSLSRVELATPQQFVSNMRQDTNFKRTFMGTLKSYPAEYGKFNAAMITLELVACFGGSFGSVFTDFTWKSSVNTPVCVDQLIKSLTTVEGNVGFFSFILANRITSTHLTNLAVLTAAHLNKPLTTERLIALRVPIGYIGMSFGMMAQQVVSQILTIPTFKECSRDIAAGKFNTPYCIEAANHFLSAEKFWMDFGAGLPSLIGGAVMSSGTHWLIKNHKFLLAKDTAKSLTEDGIKAALKTMRGLRMTKNLVSVGGGPPGWAILVGETVIFLAWSKVLEIPTMQMVWSWYDRPDIRYNSSALVEVTSAIKNAKGFSSKTVDVSCQKVIKKSNLRDKGTSKDVCRSDEKLSQSLKNLNFYAKRYRERVVLAKLQRYFPDQILKWEKYVTSYVTAKQLLQNVYALRAQNALSLARESSSLLGVYDTGYIIIKTWTNYLWAVNPQDAIAAREALKKLTWSFEELSDSYNRASEAYYADNTPQISSSGALLLPPNKSFPNQKKEVSRSISLEQNFIKQLAEFKTIITKTFPFDHNESSTCNELLNDPELCTALKSVRIIPNDPQDFYKKVRNADIYNMVTTLKSYDMISPISDALRGFLCGESEVKSYERYWLGLPAQLKMPGIVKNFSGDPLYNESCQVASYTKDLIPQAFGVDPEDNKYKALPLEKMGDLFDVLPQMFWSTQNMTYVDPLTILIDPVVALAPGLTEKDAQAWWNKKLSPEVVRFYVNYIIDYKSFLNKNLFGRMDYAEPQQLLDMGLFGNAEKFDAKEIYTKIGQKSSLNLSLIGHMQLLSLALDEVSIHGLTGADLTRYLKNRKYFLTSYAEHTRHFSYNKEPSNLDFLLKVQIESLVSKPLDADPAKFSELVTKTLFADSFKRKNARQRELQQQLGTLSEFLTGENLNKIQNIDKRLGFTAQEVSRMNPQEYRKYTILQIIQHMSLLVDETTSYYDNYVFLTGLFNFFEK